MRPGLRRKEGLTWQFLGFSGGSWAQWVGGLAGTRDREPNLATGLNPVGVPVGANGWRCS
jgi:hypothetical protein